MNPPSIAANKSMKWLDRVLQRWRAGMVGPWLKPGCRLLDAGCGDGALFRFFNNRIDSAVGLDPHIPFRREEGNILYLPGAFPNPELARLDPFDAITMLAVLEHIPPESQSELARACHELLKPGGLVIITVPSPAVDSILKALIFLRLMEGQDVDQHYGFDVNQTPGLFLPHGFALERRRTFQLGLNNVFVFRKT